MAPSSGGLLLRVWWALGAWPLCSCYAPRPPPAVAPCSDLRLLPCIGRRERKLLTAELQRRWGKHACEALWWLPTCGPGLPLPRIRRRRQCRLFERQRRSWQCQPRRRFSGWPLRGCRIGEALHPGPQPGTPLGGERHARRRQRSPSMDVDASGPGRVYCPVAGCPCGDANRARGWSDNHSMRAHIDAHMAGTLQGEVPLDWLQAQRRQRCTVCGLSVSTRHGMHPTCRPAARAAAAAGVPRSAEDAAVQLPEFDAIQSGNTRTLRHVPAAARALWGRVLARALADVVLHNDSRSWKELLMLPQSVLGPPPRGGRRHHKAAASYTSGGWRAIARTLARPPPDPAACCPQAAVGSTTA